MKDIVLTITGRQFIGEENEDQVEFVTDGKLYERNGAAYLVYEDSELSGYPGCRTSLKLTDGHLRMVRLGQAGSDYHMEMDFHKGKRMQSRYQTPFGSIAMEVMTNDVIANLSEDGNGSIVIDYDVSLDGLAEGRNSLKIDVESADRHEQKTKESHC